MLKTSSIALALCLVLAAPAVAEEDGGDGQPLRFLTGQRNVKAILVDEP